MAVRLREIMEEYPGIDGLFLEVHEDPDHAPSDGPNMLHLSTLAPLLATVQRIRAALA